MKTFYKILLFITLLLTSNISKSAEYLYILNDECINTLYSSATKHLEDSSINIIKDSRGIIIRFFIPNPSNEYRNPSLKVYSKIESFLAKIENPAIIEVHVGNLSENEPIKLKKWEFSTILANNIEAIITKPNGSIEQTRINSIGYGEFLPAKNTSNNGGEISNRVDIIILCNISGE